MSACLVWDDVHPCTRQGTLPSSVFGARGPVDVRPAVVAVDLVVEAAEVVLEPGQAQPAVAVGLQFHQCAAVGTAVAEVEVELTLGGVVDHDSCVADDPPVATGVDVGEHDRALDPVGVGQVDLQGLRAATPRVTIEGDPGIHVEAAEVLVQGLDHRLGGCAVVVGLDHACQVDIGMHVGPAQSDLHDACFAFCQRNGLILE